MRRCLDFIFNKALAKTRGGPFELQRDMSMRVRLTPELARCLGIFGLSYTFFNIAVVSLTSSFVTIPVVFEESQAKSTLSILLYVFVVANIVANLSLISRNRSFYYGGPISVSSETSQLPTASWSHCATCNHLKPPRAHHCLLCRRCILKRDHHCFFVGACVGFHNQRYFVVFCFYSFVGAAYGCYLAVHSLHIAHGIDVLSWQFFRCSIPFATYDWLRGDNTFTAFLLIMYVNLCFVTTIGAGGFAIFQFYIIALGVTLNEFKKGDRSHRSRVGEHYRSVFGPYWMLNFIFPMTSMRSMGDGITWVTDIKLK